MTKKQPKGHNQDFEKRFSRRLETETQVSWTPTVV